jgi:hypothetical protein
MISARFTEDGGHFSHRYFTTIYLCASDMTRFLNEEDYQPNY